MEFISKSLEVLGTVVEVKLPSTYAFLFPLVFSELKRIESTYSRFLDQSELSKLNSGLGIWHDVSDEFLFLLEKAVYFNKKSEGNFDVMLKSALDRLGYDKNYSFLPKPKKSLGVFSLLREYLFERISIDSKRKRVRLQKEIDFGGFGKGFALDKIAELLEHRGVLDYYINAGGDIYAKRTDQKESWTILLEHPDDAGRVIGTVKLNGGAIAGSAPNRRKWGNYHHLLNAKSKMPAKGVKAAFVVAASGIEADAYATSVFTAGFEEGIALSKRLPIEVLMVSEENKMYKSKGFGVELFN